MTKITQDQSGDRWDTLPMVLRDALFSEPNSDFLWKTCEAEHIPDPKIHDVARIAGYVLMGFIHPEDVAEEVQAAIGVDQKTAATIQSALNQRIFSPIRQDIDKIYAPLTKSQAGLQTGPKIIQEIKPSQPAPAVVAAAPALAKPTQPAPQIISQTFNATPKFGVAPVGLQQLQQQQPRPQQPQPPAQPAAASDKGWSTRAQGPVVKLGAITPGIPSPSSRGPSMSGTPNSAMSPKPPAFQTPSQQTPQKGMSEFERLDMMKKSTAAPGTVPPPQASAATPPPMMLHEVSNTAAQSPDFRFKIGMQNQMPTKPPQTPPPAKTAILEFGKAPSPTASTSTPTIQSSAPKTVHYSEYKPPVAATTDSGIRQISEFTAQPSAPVPPTPPVPTVPMAQPPKGKIIVKDFLEPTK